MNAPAAPASTPTGRTGLTLPGANSMVWLCALVGLMAALHLSMVLGRSLNWDEFWFYSLIGQVARGESIQPLQTIHTRFFVWWLPALPGNEIDHILTARLFMLACLAVTSLGIFLVAERFAHRRAALIAVAAYLGAGYVLQHGASFRIDPMVSACLATALAIAARTRLSVSAILALGAVIGLSAMLTIKMVLWAPAFAGIALWRWEEEGFDWRYPLRWIAAGAIAIGTFALLYALHSAGMNAEEANGAAAGALENSAEKMFALAQGYRITMIGKAIVASFPLFLLAAIVPLAVHRSGWTRTRKLAAMAIWSVVLTPLFYHNSYAYFYAFILPPVAATCAFAIPMITRRYGAVSILALIAASALLIWAVDPRGAIDRQKVLVEGAHEAFPEPVAYFDCCGMIGSFAKANMFRSSWGVERYLSSGRPLMLEAMHQKPIPMLLDNKRDFAPAIAGLDAPTVQAEDRKALRDTYIQLWGDIFVAGRELESDQNLRWNVLVPGTYRVSGTIEVNGRIVNDNEAVNLPRGVAELSNKGEGAARLIWGAKTQAPTQPAPVELYWTGF